MLDLGVEAREELPVARVVTGPLVVLSREGLDGLDRISQGKGREFDFGTLVLTEEPRAAVPGRAGVVGQTRLLQILDVGLLLRFPHRPTPHSRDHRVLLVSTVRDRSGFGGHDIASARGADREATECTPRCRGPAASCGRRASRPWPARCAPWTMTRNS